MTRGVVTLGRHESLGLQNFSTFFGKVQVAYPHCYGLHFETALITV